MEFVQIKIPASLYKRVERLCQATECESVEEMIIKILRNRIAELEEEVFSDQISEKERQEIIKRLQELGYI